ncbi:MAG: SMI1/KNR4 family protein [Chitinophagaceae bacterium]
MPQLMRLVMAMRNIIESIIEKNKNYGIEVNAPARLSDIFAFEQRVGFALPPDFIEFYTTCNGFGCIEDIFNLLSLAEITSYPDNYGTNWFYFAEYMIYSDMWGLRIGDTGKYEIFNGSYPAIAMTSSLEEFLNRFLKGNVFDEGGLYEWHDELQINRS